MAMIEAGDSALSAILAHNIDLFACSICGGSVRMSTEHNALQCIECVHLFKVERGIPLMFSSNDWGAKKDVTGTVKSFYDERPFPNYDDPDSDFTLQQKAERGIFARLLNEQVALGAKVLEVGCGTGQLTNYLGLKWGRTVFGSDLSLNALRLGQEFKIKNSIENVLFINMNLFRPAFKQQAFDLVICNGVLHHTSDPFLGFESIARLVKDGGHIIIGLYNRYGRIPTDIRRLLFKALGTRFMFLDSRLRDPNLSKTRKDAWFYDQYRHPHESKHTIDQILEWFKSTSFEFTNGIPKATILSEFAVDEPLFVRNDSGTWLDHLFVQTGMLLGGGKEGGFFIMIGEKHSSDDERQASPIN